MLRGIVATLEKHHHVRILDQAVIEAVRLSKRYIPAGNCRTKWSASSTRPAHASP